MPSPQGAKGCNRGDKHTKAYTLWQRVSNNDHNTQEPSIFEGKTASISSVARSKASTESDSNDPRALKRVLIAF